VSLPACPRLFLS